MSNQEKGTPLILLENIYKIYEMGEEQVRANDGINLSIQKGEFVDIYLLGTELFLRFQKKKQATQFNNAALRLLTGESKLVRGVKKGQKAIKETEDALNIDITGTAKNIALTAIDVTSVAQGKKVNTVGNFAKKFLSQKKVKQISAAEDEKKDEDA